jgi:hypothetical protein
MARYPRYTASAAASNQRCHGIGGSFSSSSSDAGAAWAWPGSTTRPQDGQVPSTFTVDGERNRSHASHHGTPPLEHGPEPSDERYWMMRTGSPRMYADQVVVSVTFVPIG